jgi:hypothetical protein
MFSISSTEFAIANEPNGLRELEHRVYYSQEIGAHLEEFNGELIFYGADYHYLRNRYINDGCGVIPVSFNDGCKLELNGNLFLNEAEWRPDICTVTLEVVDSGFLSLIDNNMGIKAYLNVARSKNDVDISSSVVVQTDLTFNSNTVAGTDTLNIEGIRVYDAYKMLIAFMTDGLISFESNFLFPDDNESDLRIPTLFTADELRNGRPSDEVLFPYISFEDLHKDMARMYHLTFQVIDGVFRLEPESYFRQSTSAIVIDNPIEVSQKSDVQSFYQKVKFGSQSDEEQDFDYYPNITFLGFRREEYHLGGQCNTKAILELETTELITDPNVIMAALPIANGGTADFNSKPEDIFIVTFDATNTTIVYPHPTDSNLQYYNYLLNNYSVALRWGDGIPFPIFQYLGANQNGSRGLLQTGYVPTFYTVSAISRFALIKFPDRTPPFGFDPNANMTDVSYALDSPPDPVGNTGTDTQLKTIYTAPVSSIYTAITKIRYAQSAQNVGSIFISRYDASPTQISIDGLGTSVQNFVNGAYEMTMSWTTYMDAGDRLAVGIVNIQDVLPDSYFQINDLDFIEKTYDPADNYLITTSFDYPVSSTEWQSFLDNRNGEITVNHANGSIKGYLKDATRKLENGITEWQIRSNFGNS